MAKIFLSLFLFFWCAAAVAQPVDVFLIGGQSNGVGQGNATQSPRVPAGMVLQYDGGVLTDANDPVGASTGATGTAWPAFGVGYYRGTGRTTVLVPSAVNASAQCANADIGGGNWDVTGALYLAAVTKLNAAITALQALGYAVTVRGILWIQGETDALGIISGVATAANYQTCLPAMLARFRAEALGGVVYPHLPLYFSLTGVEYLTPASNHAFQAIETAQLAVAAIDPFVIPAFRGAATAFANGGQCFGCAPTALHYSQGLYNLIGWSMAQAVLGGGKSNAQSHKFPILFSTGPAYLSGAASYYIGNGLQSGGSQNVWITSPLGGAIRNLFVLSNGAGLAAGESISMTVRVHGQPTMVSCSIRGPAGALNTCIDSNNLGFASPGAIFDVLVQASATVGPTQISGGFEVNSP